MHYQRTRVPLPLCNHALQHVHREMPAEKYQFSPVYSNYAFHSCCLNLLEFLKIGFGCFWDTSLIRYKLLCVIPSVSTVILQILKLCKCSQGVFTKHFLVFCILLLIGRKVPSLFLVCVPYISVFRLLPAYPLRIGHIRYEYAFSRFRVTCAPQRVRGFWRIGKCCLLYWRQFAFYHSPGQCRVSVHALVDNTA